MINDNLNETEIGKNELDGENTPATDENLELQAENDLDLGDSVFSDLDEQINKVLSLVENLRNENKDLANENKILSDENFALKELVEELNGEKQQLRELAQNLKLRLESVLSHINKQRQQQQNLTQNLNQNLNQNLQNINPRNSQSQFQANYSNFAKNNNNNNTNKNNYFQNQSAAVTHSISSTNQQNNPNNPEITAWTNPNKRDNY